MTLKGHSQLPGDAHKVMARLMQLHLQTHPKKIGATFGVHAQYVRSRWRMMPLQEMASLAEALATLERMR